MRSSKFYRKIQPIKKLKFYKKEGRFQGFIQEIFHFFPASGQFRCGDIVVFRHKKTVPWRRDGMLIDKFYASLPYDSEYLID